MSHSKMNKRGHSVYIEKYNPASKKYINSCALCGKTGYSPAIEEPDFCDDFVRRAIYYELKKAFTKLPLDALGRCCVCAELQEK